MYFIWHTMSHVNKRYRMSDVLVRCRTSFGGGSYRCFKWIRSPAHSKGKWAVPFLQQALHFEPCNKQDSFRNSVFVIFSHPKKGRWLLSIGNRRHKSVKWARKRTTKILRHMRIARLGSKDMVRLICSLSDMRRNTYDVVYDIVSDILYDIIYCTSYTILYAI